jgi:hypothetical protein
MRFLGALLLAGVAFAQTRPVPPGTAVPLTPWVLSSCWIEPRWFESLRSGPVDYCKRSLRYRRGHVDCLMFTDEVCWAVNHDTGEWSQFRSSGQERLVVCPDGPEPPTCPRLR